MAAAEQGMFLAVPPGLLLRDAAGDGGEIPGLRLRVRIDKVACAAQLLPLPTTVVLR